MDLILKTLSFCIFLLPILPAAAQAPEYRYFDKNSSLSTAEDCFFYELEARDTVVAFYCSNDAIKSIIPMKDGKRNGTALHYYSNSTLRSKTRYIDHQPDGLAESWYRNGKKKCEEFYDQTNGYKIVNYWDSLGTKTVSDGAGFCTIINEHDDGEVFSANGKIVDGKRDSVWLGFRNQSRYYEERYEAGKLIAGVSFDKEGNSYNYTEIDQNAAPKGGLEDFYRQISKNIKYPAEARRKGVQGRIFVEFIIEKDGSLSGVKCIKGIGRGCDEEAERVVRITEWNPGLQRGQRVRQKMMVPIIFKLG